MYICHAEILNFRALEKVEIPLHQFSVLLGENDVGKTSFLYALNYFGKDSMTGTIMRKNKKNPFKMFLKRYVKAIEYKETKDNTNDLIYLSKKSIINHCEKLKFKSNWDEFLNKTS